MEVDTEICEQTFSWLSRYARMLMCVEPVNPGILIFSVVGYRESIPVGIEK